VELTINTKAARPSEIIQSQHDIIRRQDELIDVLKGALAAFGAAEVPAAAAWMRGLTVQERALVGVLYASYPRTSSRYDLLERLPGRDHTQERQVQIVNILVHKIRKKLSLDAIVTERGIGFRLSKRFYESLPKDAKA
jgi:DNA-binding response OmpR family regulator